MMCARESRSLRTMMGLNLFSPPSCRPAVEQKMHPPLLTGAGQGTPILREKKGRSRSHLPKDSQTA